LTTDLSTSALQQSVGYPGDFAFVAEHESDFGREYEHVRGRRWGIVVEQTKTERSSIDADAELVSGFNRYQSMT
jgi:hypothetical protein